MISTHDANVKVVDILKIRYMLTTQECIESSTLDGVSLFKLVPPPILLLYGTCCHLLVGIKLHFVFLLLIFQQRNLKLKKIR